MVPNFWSNFSTIPGADSSLDITVPLLASSIVLPVASTPSSTEWTLNVLLNYVTKHKITKFWISYIQSIVM